MGHTALRFLIRSGLAGLAISAGPSLAATRGFTITSFDAIRVEAPVTVAVTTGTGPSARADGDQAALDRLRVEVSGRVLKITMDRVEGGAKGPGAVTLRVSTGDLGRIVLIGGGTIAVDRLRGQRADIALGGSGDVRIDAVALDRLDLMVSGAGRATLSGQVGIATLRISGPGALAAEALHVRQATISNDGPGALTVAADVTANVRASGSGDVVVAGKAACTVENRGTGHVTCGGQDY